MLALPSDQTTSMVFLSMSLQIFRSGFVWTSLHSKEGQAVSRLWMPDRRHAPTR
jgi:hypothetical protein